MVRGWRFCCHGPHGDTHTHGAQKSEKVKGPDGYCYVLEYTKKEKRFQNHTVKYYIQKNVTLLRYGLTSA